MNVLFVGDIVGKSGRTAFKALLPELNEKFRFDLVIVNGENAAAGFGITAKVGGELLHSGADVITSGNHIWDKKEAMQYLDREKRVLRPLNYPPGVPGFGSIIHTTREGIRTAVINISGRVFMQNLDCPFRTAEEEIDRVKPDADVIIIDFHAEATSEKIAFGLYFDGKVSAIIGTHTHVQTADERVMPGGTAYISDVGMTGPANSVIGMETELIFHRFLTNIPVRFEVAKGPSVFSAVVVGIDEKTGRAASIERVQINRP